MLRAPALQGVSSNFRETASLWQTLHGCEKKKQTIKTDLKRLGYSMIRLIFLAKKNQGELSDGMKTEVPKIIGIVCRNIIKHFYK